MPLLTLVLHPSLLFFASECGFLPGEGHDDNGHLLRAADVIAFTVPFIDYLSDWGSTFNVIDKQLEYTLGAALLLGPLMLD